MKLEYLPDGSPDCPLVRLYDFSTGDIARFHAALLTLESGEQQLVVIHEFPGIEAIAGCQLTLHSASKDKGSILQSGDANFDCKLTPDSWGNVAGLVEPFITGSGGYQWLLDGGEVRWLLSRSGQW